MKKKILLLIAVFCIIAVFQAHSFGLGIQGNFYADETFAPGIAIVICPTSITNLAINWHIDFDNNNVLGLTFDAVPLNLKIIPSPKLELEASRDPLSLYFNLGLGFFTNFTFTDNELKFIGGVRIPVGLSFYLGKVFEIYAHVAPSFGVNLIPAIEFVDGYYPIAVGARLWFN